VLCGTHSVPTLSTIRLITARIDTLCPAEGEGGMRGAPSRPAGAAGEAGAAVAPGWGNAVGRVGGRAKVRLAPCEAAGVAVVVGGEGGAGEGVGGDERGQKGRCLELLG
jgi:hypothetical protein